MAEDVNLLGCDAVSLDMEIPKFRNITSQCRELLVQPHNVVSQRSRVLSSTAVRTSNVTQCNGAKRSTVIC